MTFVPVPLRQLAFQRLADSTASSSRLIGAAGCGISTCTPASSSGTARPSRR